MKQSKTQSKKQNKKHQSGNAILFTLLAMVIGGVVVAVGITQYQDADRAAQIQGAVAEVNSIIGNAKQNYGQYSYRLLATADAISSRVIPPHLTSGIPPNAAFNKFGGQINLGFSPAPVLASADLEYQGVPPEICAALVNGTQGLADAIAVGAVNVKPTGGIVSVPLLSGACNVAAPVNITWTFGRT
jgi:hypothetical protein